MEQEKPHGSNNNNNNSMMAGQPSQQGSPASTTTAGVSGISGAQSPSSSNNNAKSFRQTYNGSKFQSELQSMVAEQKGRHLGHRRTASDSNSFSKGFGAHESQPSSQRSGTETSSTSSIVVNMTRETTSGFMQSPAVDHIAPMVHPTHVKQVSSGGVSDQSGSDIDHFVGRAKPLPTQHPILPSNNSIVTLADLKPTHRKMASDDAYSPLRQQPPTQKVEKRRTGSSSGAGNESSPQEPPRSVASAQAGPKETSFCFAVTKVGQFVVSVWQRAQVVGPLNVGSLVFLMMACLVALSALGFAQQAVEDMLTERVASARFYLLESAASHSKFTEKYTALNKQLATNKTEAFTVEKKAEIDEVVALRDEWLATVKPLCRVLECSSPEELSYLVSDFSSATEEDRIALKHEQEEQEREEARRKKQVESQERSKKSTHHHQNDNILEEKASSGEAEQPSKMEIPAHRNSHPRMQKKSSNFPTLHENLQNRSHSEMSILETLQRTVSEARSHRRVVLFVFFVLVFFALRVR